ncbi:hypothetical protein [Salinimicrobium sp. GXAS 041]|uniref:hypothetical protein n=1 Tax=Salinimicrobium sp. GXAS 041 TaxID=3400806 RepID=UPI003C7643BC
MRKILFISLAILLMAGCKSRKLTVDSNRFILENLAQISSSQDLKRIYPEASIEEGNDVFEEGVIQRPYNILFPGTANEALLTWNDVERTQLHHIRVENAGRWETRQGIKIGTTYEELEAFNEGPFEFYGFGWDYSGAVDWLDGKLAGTNIRVFLKPEGTPPNKFYGDRKIEASEEEIDALNLSVQAIMYQAEE